jgi:broad-specificity NMP kinase
MKFLDVAGCPGSGKSSLCYPLWKDRSVTWDGKPPVGSWRLFLDEITNLCEVIQDHPSFEAVLRMNDRSAKKMATVHRMHDDRTFIQTGFVQRILGFGWRLHEMGRDINLISNALWTMPVSVGVVFLEADLETLFQRNRDREKVPETAHENRSHQVPHMQACIPLAKDVLRERGIPIIELDVQHQSIDAARAKLVEFANQDACEPAQMGMSNLQQFCSPPPWWRN